MTRSKAAHWTEDSVEDFLYEIAADFVDQLRLVMDSTLLTQAALAKRLGLTRGRVSQIFSNPGNITLKQVIRYARALGLKVALVAYGDNDSKNERGPVNSEIFRLCWENAGAPTDFRQLSAAEAVTVSIARCDMPFEFGFLHNGHFVTTGQAGTVPEGSTRQVIRNQSPSPATATNSPNS